MSIESLFFILRSTLAQAHGGKAFVAASGEAMPWQIPARCNFGNPGELQMVALSGKWQSNPGLLVQSDPTTRSEADLQHGSAVIAVPNPKIERCRVRALVKLDNPDKPEAEAGIAVHVKDRNTYIICSIRRGKGDSLYAALTRFGPGLRFRTDAGRFGAVAQRSTRFVASD